MQQKDGEEMAKGKSHDQLKINISRKNVIVSKYK